MVSELKLVAIICFELKEGTINMQAESRRQNLFWTNKRCLCLFPTSGATLVVAELPSKITLMNTFSFIMFFPDQHPFIFHA